MPRTQPSRGRQWLCRDNGLEVVSAAVRKWCEAGGTETLYIAPDSP